MHLHHNRLLERLSRKAANSEQMPQGSCDKLQGTVRGCDLVGDDPEASLGCGGAVRQDLVDEAKQLLHDRVLAQVVVA